MGATDTRHRTVSIVQQLADDGAAFAFVMENYRRSMEAGEFVAGRLEPTGGESCAVLSENDVPIGYATFFAPPEPHYIDRKAMWLDLIWVAAAHRCAGGARLMIRSILDETRRRGLERIEFGTTPDNEQMQLVAKMMGFSATRIDFTRAIGAAA